MHLAVGSTNPLKRADVEDALEPHNPTVTAVAVDSGVPEQPWGFEETIQGATTRARRALEATNATYGVGLEGGVAQVSGVPGVSLIMWACVTDGTHDSRGGGPTIRLPDTVAARLEAGEELGPVMDDVLGTTNVAQDNGAIGVLTNGLTDRKDALRQAVVCAFGPFVTDQYTATTL